MGNTKKSTTLGTKLNIGKIAQAEEIESNVTRCTAQTKIFKMRLSAKLIAPIKHCKYLNPFLNAVLYAAVT